MLFTPTDIATLRNIARALGHLPNSPEMEKLVLRAADFVEEYGQGEPADEEDEDDQPLEQ